METEQLLRLMKGPPTSRLSLPILSSSRRIGSYRSLSVGPRTCKTDFRCQRLGLICSGHDTLMDLGVGSRGRVDLATRTRRRERRAAVPDAFIRRPLDSVVRERT